MNKIATNKIISLPISDKPVVTPPLIDKLSGVVDLKVDGLCNVAYSVIIDWFQGGELGFSQVKTKGNYQLAVKILLRIDGNEQYRNRSSY